MLHRVAGRPDKEKNAASRTKETPVAGGVASWPPEKSEARRTPTVADTSLDTPADTGADTARDARTPRATCRPCRRRSAPELADKS